MLTHRRLGPSSPASPLAAHPRPDAGVGARASGSGRAPRRRPVAEDDDRAFRLREAVEGAFDVTYGPRDDLDVLIPERLWEWYRTPDLQHLGRPAYVEGEASYGRIRRFTVTSEVTIR